MTLAHRWDCLGYEEEEERPRPQFVVRAPIMEENPITGEVEASFPKAARLPRMMTSLSTMILMVIFVVCFIVAVIVYRGMIRLDNFKLSPYRFTASPICNHTNSNLSHHLQLCFISK